MNDEVIRNEQNMKLNELHLLQEVQNDINNALQTDCDTFKAQQELLNAQSKLQSLQLEYDFLASNFMIQKQKLERQAEILNDICDYFSCQPEEILNHLLQQGTLLREQAAAVGNLEQSVGAQSLQISQLRQSRGGEMQSSVTRLWKKYHSEGHAVPDLRSLRLNSEKIIQDELEILQ